MKKKSSKQAPKKALRKNDVMLSVCKVCNGNGYYMKIGDYDGKIKGRVVCSCKH